MSATGGNCGEDIPKIPDLDRPVLTCRYEPFSLAVKCDRRHVPSMAFEGDQLDGTNLSMRDEETRVLLTYGFVRGAGDLVYVDLLVDCCCQKAFAVLTFRIRLKTHVVIPYSGEIARRFTCC